MPAQGRTYPDLVVPATRKQLNAGHQLPASGPVPGMPQIVENDGFEGALVQHQLVSFPLAQPSDDHYQDPLIALNGSHRDVTPPSRRRLYAPPVPAAGRALVAYLRDQARQMLDGASPLTISGQEPLAPESNHVAKDGKHRFENLHDPLAGIYDQMWGDIQQATELDLTATESLTNHLGNVPLNCTPRHPDRAVIPVFLLDPISNHSLTFIDDDGYDPPMANISSEITAAVRDRAHALGKQRCGRCWRWRFEDKFSSLEDVVCVFCLRNGEVPGWVLSDCGRTSDVAGGVLIMHGDCAQTLDGDEPLR